MFAFVRALDSRLGGVGTIPWDFSPARYFPLPNMWIIRPPRARLVEEQYVYSCHYLPQSWYVIATLKQTCA